MLSQHLIGNVEPPELSAQIRRTLFMNAWIKPAVVSYIFTSGINMAMPHFFGQTIGRIPVVGDWVSHAFKTVFEKMPRPVFDTLMTAGSTLNYKNIKSLFYIEPETNESRPMKITNAAIFLGSSALVGYAIRMSFQATGHVPEEGFMLPVAGMLPPECEATLPEAVLADLYLWNENIYALSIAAQTFVTPVVEVAAKAITKKAVDTLSPYLKKCFFASAQPLVTEINEEDSDNELEYASASPSSSPRG
jgi:hypothetical protein